MAFLKETLIFYKHIANFIRNIYVI